MNARIATPTVLSLALLAACRDATAPAPASIEPPVASVWVRQSALTLNVGDSRQIDVTLRDATSKVVSRSIVYASSNPAVATVSSWGLVTAVGLDTCTIKATSEGQSAAVTVAVVPVPRPQLLPQQAFLWTAAGGLTDLGVPPGFTSSRAIAINAVGQVVGIGGNDAQTHALLWSASGAVRDLGTLPGDDWSSAAAINSFGQVAGEASINGRYHAVVWSPAGVIRDLGTLPGDVASAATGVNDAGQVVGNSYPPAQGAPRLFIWTEAGGMVEPLNVAPYFVIGHSINRTGLIAGEIASSADVRLPLMALRVTAAGRPQPLASVPGFSSAAYAINDAGDAVGSATSCLNNDCADFDAFTHAILWSGAGGAVDLGALPGFDPTGSTALGINNRGQVVGQSGSRAFLWSQAGGFVDIGVLSLRSWSVALGVNDAGRVVGSSR
jgi:probable HAF family extracellular repeat protein